MEFGIADLHVHSLYSYDSTSSIEVLLDSACAAGLDLIALTDHDSIEGLEKALDLGPEYGIGVIPGCEISTRDGHLLALFLDEYVPPGLPLGESLLRIGDAGGLAVAPHPMAGYTHSLGADYITWALNDPDLSRVLVGIETINGSLPLAYSNERAKQLCRRLGVAETGSSDAHMGWMIGSVVTRFPGRSAEDLRRSLVEKSTLSEVASKERLAQIMGSSVYHWLLRRLGWGFWSPAQGGEYRLRRLAEIAN